eukprot:TRINITY_DN1999_c0_g4_i1.p2 TRINITY_DN1999_c0_g4~~TRINITY_DN1999_c0_g4_i1.p2  ORF type:complete len:403 (+),score=203.78 TRINITY_DN1999_c0_g4_i1:53-1261(+)
MSSQQEKTKAEMEAAAQETLQNTESFMDIPDEELMTWTHLPDLAPGETAPGWRKRLEDPEGWRELPMFMDENDELDPEKNDMVAALQDIMYNDISPEELAEKCKSNGNQAMKQAAVSKGGTAGPKGSYRTALSWYTEGIDAKTSDKKVLGALYANRAQAQLELENYGHCVADCQDALRIDPKDAKCCYRAAKACNAVKKPERAMMFINRGLLNHPDHKALQAQKKVADEIFSLLAKKKKQADMEKKRNLAGWMESVQLLVDSGIQVGKSELLSSHWNEYGAQGPRLVDGVLHLSMIFIYDEYNTSDFITEVQLEHSVYDHLCAMFPPEGAVPDWDEKGRYQTEGLTAFYAVGDKKVELPQVDQCFHDVLRRKDYVCPGFLPTFHILPFDAPYAKKWRAGDFD